MTQEDVKILTDAISTATAKAVVKEIGAGPGRSNHVQRGGDTMAAIQLARRVQEMRHAQKLYFLTRDVKTLDERRRIEREIDKLVDEIISDRPAMLPFDDDDEDGVVAEGKEAFEKGGQAWADWNMANNPFGD